jgi:hypothetical protein
LHLDVIWKAKDMRRDPCVALPLPIRQTRTGWPATDARVVDVCPDEDWRYKDPMSIKYTSGPFLSHGPDRRRWRLSA